VEKISPTLLCFAVFDGHGGSIVSDFVSKTIIDHIKFWLLKEHDLGVVLRQTFIDVNNMLARNLFFYSLVNKIKEVVNRLIAPIFVNIVLQSRRYCTDLLLQFIECKCY
jgi:serine/threonine protein phosphatase PrpC